MKLLRSSLFLRCSRSKGTTFSSSSPKNRLFVLPAFFLLTSPRPVRSFWTMPFHTERSDGTITVSPKNEAHQSALVVISHGLGDTAEGFADVAEMLAKELPWCKFILPTAPTQPVTMNMGMSMPSWYDITGLDERSNENCKGLEISEERLANILKTEHETNGLPYSRMVLAGFSQGGALSLFTGFGLPEKLAGIVCLSGYLPAASKFKITSGNERLPVLHCHGTQDVVVAHTLAEKTKAKLLEKGVESYTLNSYPISHTVSPEELTVVKGFLQRVLPDDSTHRISVKAASEMSVKELKAAIRKAGLSTVGFMEKSEFVKLLEDYRSKN